MRWHFQILCKRYRWMSKWSSTTQEPAERGPRVRAARLQGPGELHHGPGHRGGERGVLSKCIALFDIWKSSFLSSINQYWSLIMNIALLGLDNSLIMYAETESESRRGRGKLCLFCSGWLQNVFHFSQQMLSKKIVPKITLVSSKCFYLELCPLLFLFTKVHKTVTGLQPLPSSITFVFSVGIQHDDTDRYLRYLISTSCRLHPDFCCCFINFSWNIDTEI